MHILFLMLFVVAASAAERQSQWVASKLLATDIPRMRPESRDARIHPVKYQDLGAFDLVRMKRGIEGRSWNPVIQSTTYGYSPRLKFQNSSPFVKLKAGDFVRLLDTKNVSSQYSLETVGTRRVAVPTGYEVYELVGFKMSADFKTTGEFFSLHVLAQPGDEVYEFERFEHDLLSLFWHMRYRDIRKGDIVINAAEAQLAGRGLPANTPAVVTAVSSERVPWTFTWRYTFTLKLLRCPENFKALNCTVTDSGVDTGNPNKFWGRYTLR